MNCRKHKAARQSSMQAKTTKIRALGVQDFWRKAGIASIVLGKEEGELGGSLIGTVLVGGGEWEGEG